MNLAVSIFDFPATVWRDGLINLTCIVFAFWYFRAKRFPFLRIGKIGEWAFQWGFISLLFFVFQMFFGIRVELLHSSGIDTLDSSVSFFGSAFAFLIFIAMWLKNQIQSSR